MIIRGVVNELNNFGFDCYWAGNNGALAWAGVVPENGENLPGWSPEDQKFDG